MGISIYGTHSVPSQPEDVPPEDRGQSQSSMSLVPVAVQGTRVRSSSLLALYPVRTVVI